MQVYNNKWSSVRLVNGLRYYLLYAPLIIIFLAAACASDDGGAETQPGPTITPAPPDISIPYSPESQNIQVDLSWEPFSQTIVEIDVERRESLNGTSSLEVSHSAFTDEEVTWGNWINIAILPPGNASYSDTSVSCGKSYEYRVCAVEGNGARGCSAPVKATTPICPPKDLTATLTAQGEIELNWIDNSHNELWFKIYRKTPADSLWNQIAGVPENTTTYLDTDVSCGTTYQYKIRAANYYRNSGYSNEASVTTETCPACSDGIDNDGDTLTDFPDDPECSSLTDLTEDNWIEVGIGSATGGGISNSHSESGKPSHSLDLDSSGNPVVVWSDVSSGNEEIYIKRWNGSAWVEVGAGSASGGGISNNSGRSIKPSLSLDSSDNPVVAWNDDSSGNEEIYIKRWNGSAWVEVGAGSATGGGISNNSGNSYGSYLSLDSSGNPVVAWSDVSSGNHEIYIRRWNGSAWVEVGAGSASGGGISNDSGWSSFPSLSLDSSDNPVVAWNDNSSGDHYVFIKRWNGSAWVEVGAGSASGGGISNGCGWFSFPSLSLDSSGNPVVAWNYYRSGDNREIYIKRWDGSEWAEIGAGSASGGGISNNNGLSGWSSLALDSFGNPVVSWRDNTSGNNEIYIRRWQP